MKKHIFFCLVFTFVSIVSALGQTSELYHISCIDEVALYNYSASQPLPQIKIEIVEQERSVLEQQFYDELDHYYQKTWEFEIDEMIAELFPPVTGVDVYNLSGELLYSARAGEGEEVDLDALPKGASFLMEQDGVSVYMVIEQVK